MTTHVPRPAAAPDGFDPAGQAQAEAAFLDANPAFRDTAAVDELRAAEYGRLDASGDVYLDYTGGSLYAALAARGAPAPAARHRLRQPALGQPDVVGRDRARRAGARRRAAATSTRPRASTRASSRRTPRARCGSSARPTRSGPRDASWRRSTTTTRSTASASSPRAKGARDGVRPARGARPARGRRAARALPRRGRAGRPQPLRLSRAVELLRRQAPARVDRARPRSAAGT